MLYWLSLGRARFAAGDVSFRHWSITRHSNVQRHIDADSFADKLLAGGQPIGRRGDLDKDIGPFQRGPQSAGCLRRPLGVVRQAGIGLQADLFIFASVLS